jgi:TolB-like protein/DNA-binding winged helix-turn-helix (wHTH) protein/Flp pilus assembly protein TadD
MQQLQHQTLSFDGFTLDLTRGCLLGRGGEEKKLRPKSFEVLRHLVENSGRLVSKDELLSSLWSDTAVTDDSLVQCLMEVRRALGDAGQRLIKTVPRRGYIFEAEVTTLPLAGREVVYSEEVEGVHLTYEEETLEDENTRRSNAPALRESWRRLRHPSRARRIALSCIALVLSAVTLMLLSHRTDSGEGQTATIRSIAVLPLENLSGDPAQEYFADGMTEALINNLAQIRALKVISRTSALRYKGNNKSLPEIARELNVDAVITGSVQRSGARVRVTAQLIHAATDAHLWARNYERDLTDVLKLESEVARAVADEIRIQVTVEERARLASARKVDPEAHEAYLLGRYHNSKGDEQGWKQAIEYFERAIQIAPDYAAAYAGLSDAWLYRGVFGANFKQVESPLRAAALKAIGLDEQLAEAHNSLANIKQYCDWDWAGAEAEFKRALELDPGSLLAHISYGHLLMHLGRHDEAIKEGELAVQLDPLSSATQASLGRFLFRARRYEEALLRLKRAVELEPRSVGANYRLGDVYTQLGKHSEAIAAYERIRETMPRGGDLEAAIARVYALMGRQREARQMIIGSKANASVIAAVYAALGDRDAAFSILEKAVEERQILVALKEDPPYENLHSDRRWRVLLSRMNFPPD